MESVGNLARSLVLRNNQVRLREEMDKLAVEVSTGMVKDSGRHLGGDITGLLAIDRSLSKLDAYQVNTTEATYLTSSMQTTLEEMQSRAETVSQTLISAELTASGELLSTMSEDAREALDQVLNGLNRSVAGRFLFSGTATDRASVLGIDDMMAELVTAVTGATDLAGVEAALETFFDTGGGYETVIYQGSDDGIAPLRLGENETASFDIRATNSEFRELLKPLAMAALASEGALGFDTQLQTELLAQAGSDLLEAQKPMVELRAGLGALEARIEDTTARNAAERTAANMARLELVGTDEYETAVQYESVRNQLESLYAVTARSQRLSFAEFI